MKICNNQQPIIPINNLHLHKLRTLLEKINELNCKMSDEMKDFKIELE